MRSILIPALVYASWAQIPPASAETLRCGSALIEPGDDALYVLEKCGEPNLTAARAASAHARSAGVPFPTAALRGNLWRYNRGPGKFPAVLTIGDDGRVALIQFDLNREADPHFGE